MRHKALFPVAMLLLVVLLVALLVEHIATRANNRLERWLDWLTR